MVKPIVEYSHFWVPMSELYQNAKCFENAQALGVKKKN